MPVMGFHVQGCTSLTYDCHPGTRRVAVCREHSSSREAHCRNRAQTLQNRLAARPICIE